MPRIQRENCEFETHRGHGPFFSPDGRWLAFFANQELKKLSLDDGAVLTLAEAAEGRGGVWRSDGMIFYVPGHQSGMMRIADVGGVPHEVTRPDSSRHEISHRWPSLLPDGQHAVITVQLEDGDSGVAIVSLAEGDWTHLIHSAYDGRYLQGEILYQREGVVLTRPFDVERLAFDGEETPLLRGVNFDQRESTQASLAVSESGVTSYTPTTSTEFILRRVSLDGRELSSTSEPRPFSQVSLSPDGRQVALGVLAGENFETWTFDFERDLLSRLTDRQAHVPVWSPDGVRVAVVERGTLSVISADGAEDPVGWVEHSQNLWPSGWTPDGQAVLYARRNGAHHDLALKAVDGEERILLGGEASEIQPVISPDGRWLAYTSNENGQDDIFVRAFPDLDRKVQVSTVGGTTPVWAPDGGTLYYLHERALMASRLSLGRDRLVAGVGQPLFDVAVPMGTLLRTYDIAPDGESFVFIVDPDPKPLEIHVVVDGTAGVGTVGR